jgi:hypothetical protein
LTDIVNNPPHYTSDPSGIECIQITRHRNYNIGNAIKYLWRAGLKSDPKQSAIEKQVEDLQKAVFYIHDEIRRLNGDKVEPPTDNDIELDKIRLPRDQWVTIARLIEEVRDETIRGVETQFRDELGNEDDPE